MKKQEIIEYLKTQEKELKANNLELVYRHLNSKWAGLLTEFFLDNNIDPLQYMHIIPRSYAYRVESYYNNKLDIPNNITVIDAGAFFESRLKEIFIPSSVTYIRDNAFAFSDLKKVTIDGCPKLGKDVFVYCTSIKNIKINCSKEDWFKQNPKKGLYRDTWPEAFDGVDLNAKLKFLK